MDILKARVNARKLTLVASERLLKKRFHRLRILNPRYARGFMRYRSLVNHSHVHALAIGHYAAGDLRIIGAFGDRIWKWGYFVDVNPEAPRPRLDQPLKVLWVGRMLRWKRVDSLLRALAHVQNSSWFGECMIVGDGPEKFALQRLAERLGLNSKRVQFQQPVPFNEVRRMMRDSDVYVLPSNRGEGWGVVASEAMSEGCVLVANEEAGAARELVIEGETGFLYQDNHIYQLASILERLANNYPLRMQIRKQAWERIHALWHPRVAAERLISLCEGLVGEKNIPKFEQGPCCKVIESIL
jgi:glycosyltransferase involved in cell wall biosynthesis